MIILKLAIQKDCTIISSKLYSITKEKFVKANFKLQVYINILIARKIREIIEDKLEKDICLEELDFQLYQVQESKPKQTVSENQFELRRYTAIV